MFLAGYWVYNLKRVDISLLKHIKPWCVGGFFFTMPRVSIADRNRTLGYLETGWIVPRVNRHVGVHQSTIHRLVQRHQQTNAVAGRRPRSGRPRVTSDRQDRHVVTSAFYQYQPQLGRPVEHTADQSAMIQFVAVWDTYFSFQPVLHDWCTKGRGMCYPVCGMVHLIEP